MYPIGKTDDQAILVTLTHEVITALAPDQASLKAAHGLMKVKKWPLRECSDAEGLVWGECQGSGANPYRTVFDKGDHGYKCTCPSRKFPCKHALALMWMYVDASGDFAPGPVPEWITDWMGRRRRTGAAPAATSGSGKAKSMAAAKVAEPEKASDPKAEARKRAAAERRAVETETALHGAVAELEQWISDQLRTGLSGMLDELTDRCRAIAARMVDGKAQALGSRLDELPARLLRLGGEARLDALVIELGKLVLLTRAWVASPEDPELRRMVATSETRNAVLDNPDAARVRAIWEVVGEQISTRRDGMVSHATWLMNLESGLEFALLLDFFPAATGKRASSFAPGDQFQAEMVFYPAKHPLRAVIADRESTDDIHAWPDAVTQDPLAAFMALQDKAPWLSRSPILLPQGRLCANGAQLWWQSADRAHVLPLANPVEDQVRGMELTSSVGLWDGQRLTLMAAQTDWGRVSIDA